MALEKNTTRKAHEVLLRFACKWGNDTKSVQDKEKSSLKLNVFMLVLYGFEILQYHVQKMFQLNTIIV